MFAPRFSRLGLPPSCLPSRKGLPRDRSGAARGAAPGNFTTGSNRRAHGPTIPSVQQLGSEQRNCPRGIDAAAMCQQRTADLPHWLDLDIDVGQGESAGRTKEMVEGQSLALGIAMLEAYPISLVLGAVLVVGVIFYAGLRRGDVGRGRFFADQTYHFQTLRALNDVPSDGADTSEVLETIKHIRSGDAQGWIRTWSDTGDRVSRLAAATTDRLARGRALLALLRAHNYYRTAEFFLPPDDPKHPVSAAKNIQSFYAGLDALGVAYERIEVPYGEGHHLEAVYYPAADRDPMKPLIVLIGGYDSTLEELLFRAGQGRARARPCCLDVRRARPGLSPS